MDLAENLFDGDIFVTRNEEENTTPGWWNHLAIYVGNGQIAEAQAEPGCVILTDINGFWDRYPQLLIIRHLHKDVREKAAHHARRIEGRKYWRWASIFKTLKSPILGENCVSVVRRAYLSASGVDYGWRRPDKLVYDVENLKNTDCPFIEVLHKP